MLNNGLLDHPFPWKWVQSVSYSKSCRLLLNMKASYLQGLQIHVKASFREFEKVKLWKEIKRYSVSLAWKKALLELQERKQICLEILYYLEVNWMLSGSSSTQL